MTEKEWLGESNSLGIDIWNKKYRYNNESFEEWLNRISNNNENIKQLIKEKKFLFGGRILSNRGIKDRRVTLSNCYVVSSPEDSIESIYEAVSKLARTYSYGGGCGIDISKLAPAGAKVNNAAGTSSGAVSFMDTFSQVTEQICQNGRRGALMITLDCNHPDIEEFVDIKRDLTRVTKANISIKFTDDFMKAVEEDLPYTLSFTRPETNEVIEKTISAKKLFYRLAENNWHMAEPGCLFWDTICRENLLQFDENFSYASTNPCAEEPLPAGGSCLLGSLNLSAFVRDEKFDFDEFEKAVSMCIFALDEVLKEGMPMHPLEEQRKSVNDWRQIGLGIFGLADMLVKLKIQYGSKESIELCDKIGQIMASQAINTSAYIASTLEPYPNYNVAVLKSNFFKRHKSDLIDYGCGLAHSQLLTIAPTGSISTMLGVSGGIEPIFATSYTRKTESLNNEETYYKVYTPIVKEYIDSYGGDDNNLPNYFITSEQIDYKDRIAMQAIWQKHIDASISSTVNLPESTTIDEVFDLYLRAWKAGLKGITIFRNNCDRTGVLTTNPISKKAEFERGQVIPVDDEVIGLKKKLQTGCGTLHCEAFFDENNGELREIYLSKGSTGGCNNFMIGLSRMISLSARAGVSIDDIVDQLMSTGSCPSYRARTATKHDTSKGSCCPMAVGYALKELQQRFLTKYKPQLKNNIAFESKEEISENKKCPQCGAELVFEGGCNICKSCGWTKCD